MSTFCRRVLEYMYEKRLDEFISSFYELYGLYSHMDEESFLREWFDRKIIRRLVRHFPPSIVASSFEELRSTKRNLLKTYVKTYWNFCKNPKKHPVRVEEAMRFFNLDELSEDRVKSSYREMVKKFHPDKAGRTKEAHRMMVKVNYYYQILKRYISDRRKEVLSVG